MTAVKRPAPRNRRTTVRRAKRANGAARAILDDLGVDAICERIMDGESLNQICASVGIDRRTMHEWTRLDDERRHWVDAARIASAEALGDAALEILEAATDEFQLKKARELASHLRWQAKSRDPRRYGGKMQVEAFVDVNLMDEDAVNAELAKYVAMAERDQQDQEDQQQDAGNE